MSDHISCLLGRKMIQRIAEMGVILLNHRTCRKKTNKIGGDLSDMSVAVYCEVKTAIY